MRSAPVLVLPLVLACASARAPLAFETPAPWSEPIADALAVGARAFPDGFQRAITTLQVFEGRLWLGYGDGTQNLGTRVPIEFRSFARPDDPHPESARVRAVNAGAPQRTPGDSGEEVIEPYRVLAGRLWQAGADSNDPDEAWSQAKGEPRPIEGNVFVLEHEAGEPVWRKFRSIAGGEHVHDLAELDGVLYAVGSGANDRVEWEEGRVFRYLWHSTDGGAHFTPLHRVQFPELGGGDTRFRRLLVVGHTLHAFGFVNPSADGGPAEGRHVSVEHGVVRELEGTLARRIVTRTFPLAPDLGLVVTRTEQGTTPAFLAREAGFEELASWAGWRVRDVVPGRSPDEFLLLAAEVSAPDAYRVLRFERDDPARLEPVLDLAGLAPSALALWHGALFLGTEDGRVLRARARL